MGSEDYIQSLYPEDDVVDNGKFLIVRSYPDYLANRLASIERNTDGSPVDLFSHKYAIPGIDTMPMQEKGRVVAVAFWILADDSRESMFEVMKRYATLPFLHDFVLISYQIESVHQEEHSVPPRASLRPRKTTATPPLEGSAKARFDDILQSISGVI